MHFHYLHIVYHHILVLSPFAYTIIFSFVV